MPPSRLAASLGAGPPGAAPAAQALLAQGLQAYHEQQARRGEPAAAAASAERPCRVCATPNAPNLRYCTSCGSALDSPQPAPQPAPQPVAAEPAAAPRLVQPAAPAPVPAQASSLIAPTRVVDLGQAARPAADAPRLCQRCRGVVDAMAQFCKFCGAPLADAPGGAAQAHIDAPTPHVPFAPRGAGQVQAAPPVQPAALIQAVAPIAPPAPPPGDHAHPSAPPRPTTPTRPPPPVPPHGQAAAAPLAPGLVPSQPPAATAAAIPAAIARATPRGRLVVIAKSGADGPSYPIGDVLDIGRAEGQIVVGEDPYLSPRHVRITWTGATLLLQDLASTNGVYVRLAAARDIGAGNAAHNGAGREERVPGEVAVPLQDQDLILVGQQVLRFESVMSGLQGEGAFTPVTEHGTLLFGSPASPRYARLSQRSVEGVTRDVYYLRKVETVLGRESGDVVFTEDPFLSRRHAAIRVVGRDGQPLPAGSKPDVHPASPSPFVLIDLGSSNGTYLRIRGETELFAGDHFRVGQQLFRVDLDRDPHDGRGRAG